MNNIIKGESLQVKFWFYVYRICMKTGIIRIKLRTEKQGNMLIVVLEPKWLWQR